MTIVEKSPRVHQRGEIEGRASVRGDLAADRNLVPRDFFGLHS
jgi:hypothetical protein